VEDASDGWHVTSVARSFGWRHFEIVVHPYTGNVGDVEFFIDGQKVGEGGRLADGGTVWPPGNVRIGADPTFMDEDYVANTYQNTYYDDVELFVQDKGDFDFDGDVDLTISALQSCSTDQPPGRRRELRRRRLRRSIRTWIWATSASSSLFQRANRPAGRTAAGKRLFFGILGEIAIC